MNEEKTICKLTGALDFCYKCNSQKIVKNGKDKNGRQKYLCKACFCILTANARPNKIEEEQEGILEALTKSFYSKDKITITSIARTIQRCEETTLKYLKEVKKRNEKR